jgi:GDPmannose 4,6-dehydratase
MWLMLQADEPEDFVIATGETHTVREAVEIAFGRQGIDPEEYLEIDPKYYRPSEVDVLLGDASKAKEKLAWEPRVRFQELVELMVDADVRALQDQLAGKIARYSHEGA